MQQQSFELTIKSGFKNDKYRNRKNLLYKDKILEGIFAKLGNEWDDFVVKPEVFYEAGDTVVATGYYSGTYKKTGKDFNARYAHVWKIEDGKLKAMEQFVDTLLVDRALRPD